MGSILDLFSTKSSSARTTTLENKPARARRDVNYSGRILRTFKAFTGQQFVKALEVVATCFETWRRTKFAAPAGMAAIAIVIRRPRVAEWHGRSHWARRGLFALGITLLAAGRGAAAPTEYVAAPSAKAGTRPAPAPNPFGDDELFINEVFQSHLPLTMKAYALRLWVHPHLGDYLNMDHLRMTTGIGYGLSKRWEIRASSDLFFSHGHGEVRAFENYGGANLLLGTKVNLGQFLIPGWILGAGVEYEFPLGHPPAELTDGLRHLRPYVTFSHRLESRPDLRIFMGFRFDAVSRTSVTGEFGKNALKDSSTGVTGGWVIDRDNWHYTFEASYDTTRLIGRNHADIFTVRPGVIWEMPTRRNSQAGSHWVVGVGLNCIFGPGGSSLGGSFKLRYNIDLKNRLRRTPIHAVP